MFTSDAIAKRCKIAQDNFCHAQFPRCWKPIQLMAIKQDQMKACFLARALLLNDTLTTEEYGGPLQSKGNLLDSLLRRHLAKMLMLSKPTKKRVVMWQI